MTLRPEPCGDRPCGTLVKQAFERFPSPGAALPASSRASKIRHEKGTFRTTGQPSFAILPLTLRGVPKKTKANLEFLLVKAELKGIPEKGLLRSRNIGQVDLIWPQTGGGG